MYLPKRIDLTKRGLEKFLGKIEIQILQFLWIYEKMTILEFVNYQKSKGKIYHANTITTVANRMVNKKLLKKEKGIKQHRYFAMVPETYLKKIILIETKKIFDEFN